MKSAFGSAQSAVGFALLLVLLLALPLVMARVGWRARRDAYLSVVPNAGTFPWIEEKIFQETNPVDVAFVGSSRIWAGISAPSVKTQLEQRLGRRAEVFTLGWNWSGYDMLYAVVRDLLEHRQVRLLVLYNEDAYQPHPYAQYLIRPGEQADALQGMPLAARASCYASAVLGTPRQLWGMLQDAKLDPHWSTGPFYVEPGQDDITQQYGSMRKRRGFGQNAFVPFHPKIQDSPPEVLQYQPSHPEGFEFVGPDCGVYQRAFALRLTALCREHGTKVVALFLPLLAERNQEVMSWHEPWPELAKSITLLGIPNARLFNGMSAEDVEKLFYDGRHFNQNGQDFFTTAITPALLEMYASATNSF